jgi:hypothetical protein
MDHTGDLVLTGFTDQVDDKSGSALLTKQWQNLFQSCGSLPDRFLRFQGIEDVFKLIHDK